jgi:hypothetical protein
VELYSNEQGYIGERPAPIGNQQAGSRFNTLFDRKLDQLAYRKFKFYMKMDPQSSQGLSEPALILSMVHLRRGIFMTADSNNLLSVLVPGKSQRNYLGCLEEDNPAMNLQLFGTHIKNQKDEEL